MSGRLLQLAWRNLWRNPRRTFITMAAIAFGYVMLLFVACLMAGLRWQMIENGTCLVMSQIQVHAPDYYPSRSIQKTLGGRQGTDVSAMLAAITADRRVYAAAPRVYGYGLLSAAHRSAGVELMGIIPDQEPKVTTLNSQIAKGSYLSARLPKGSIDRRHTRDHDWHRRWLDNRSADTDGRRFDRQRCVHGRGNFSQWP